MRPTAHAEVQQLHSLTGDAPGRLPGIPVASAFWQPPAIPAPATPATPASTTPATPASTTPDTPISAVPDIPAPATSAIPAGATPGTPVSSTSGVSMTATCRRRMGMWDDTASVPQLPAALGDMPARMIGEAEEC
ncbi:hypothetical protein [Nonomuraea sp. LPB2021202275-12-8]|uniref:hypothetical protein n=1 Tax=Nonomuraea sp. LPB2021202275-12-8 TaxID=3120159 RepID=UPI00300D452A